MATFTRYVRDVCTVFESAFTLRISRNVRRRALTANSEPEHSGVKDLRVKSSANEAVFDRSVSQKHGGVFRAPGLQFSPTAPQTTAGDETTTASKLINHVNGLYYEKALPGDKRLSRLVNLARFKKLREQQGKIVLEGRRLISDALEVGALPQTVFFSSVERLQELPLNKLTQASLIKAKLEDIRIWSDLGTTQDLIAILKRPEGSQMQFSEKYGKALPLTLICDNMRDPGNLGTTLRCAAAAGCSSVLLTKGCVDIWEPKVLRIAMGAHFHLPIIPNLTWSDIQSRLPANTTVHVADNCKDLTHKPEISAASLQQKKASEYGWVNSRSNLKQMHYEDDFTDNEDYIQDMCKQSKPDLETQPYHFNWACRHTAIVIGGETHGLSHEALRLAGQTGGKKLLIPMVHGMESLNSAMAASVLLFEGRRQLMLVSK
ncbi:rRNA methyltransferase 3B, mitochondrial [Hoplias malabaricus]|uniref:rRNA methyltransferase 3B, mitochondrial n=1 Tax=Hoplias malabaricus TaxID=27720 RepID=UPI003461A667